jgi:hypothetical protein
MATARRHGGHKQRAKREDKHTRELRDVKRIVQQELIRAGHLIGPPRDDWTYAELIDPPTERGAQNERHFVGRAAVVLYAGHVVEQSSAYASSALGQFAERLREFTYSGTRLLTQARTQGRLVIAELSNGDLARRAGLAFGAQQAPDEPVDWIGTKATLTDIGRNLVAANRILTAVTAREPAPVAAGFYGPKGAGPLAHLIWLLHCDGLKPEDIAEILGRLPGAERFGVEQGRWRDRCATASGTEKLRSTRDDESRAAVSSEHPCVPDAHIDGPLRARREYWQRHRRVPERRDRAQLRDLHATRTR